MAYVKLVIPGGGPILTHSHNLLCCTNMKTHAKFGSSKPYGLGHEDI